MKLSRDFAYDPKSYNNKYMTPEELESAREFLKNSTHGYKSKKSFCDSHNRYIGDYLEGDTYYETLAKLGIDGHDYETQDKRYRDINECQDAIIYRKYKDLRSKNPDLKPSRIEYIDGGTVKLDEGEEVVDGAHDYLITRKPDGKLVSYGCDNKVDSFMPEEITNLETKKLYMPYSRRIPNTWYINYNGDIHHSGEDLSVNKLTPEEEDNYINLNITQEYPLYQYLPVEELNYIDKAQRDALISYRNSKNSAIESVFGSQDKLHKAESKLRKLRDDTKSLGDTGHKLKRVNKKINKLQSKFDRMNDQIVNPELAGWRVSEDSYKADVYKTYNRLKSEDPSKLNPIHKVYDAKLGKYVELPEGYTVAGDPTNTITKFYKGPDKYFYTMTGDGKMNKVNDQIKLLNYYNGYRYDISDHPDYNKFVDEYNKNFDSLV